ncbi:hypothetical protein [Pelovirga terrestris]|uniref:Uncharacterized protein n=1 Tax=Pelovirga terrestris TaxID=2771352 RepID=A0A8J6UNR2_9BACT|nr:hypothetical protein [Pelovirga terrestris]MBD1399944.1 hypothetical protein [Pelovirga terrestris]
MNQIKLLTGSATPSPLPATKPAVFRDTANRNTTDSMTSAPAEMETSLSAPLVSRSKLPPGVEEIFLRPRHPGASSIHYRPLIFAEARLHFVNARSRIDCWQTVQLMHPVVEHSEKFAWNQADQSLTELAAFDRQPLAGAEFAAVPDASVRPNQIKTWGKMLPAHIYQEITL